MMVDMRRATSWSSLSSWHLSRDAWSMSNFGMQPPALRAAADTARYAATSGQ